MRLAISGLAWDVAEDEAIARLLWDYAIDAIDVIPGKYFPIPAEADRQRILDVKHWWADRGMEILGMQALLFGTSGLNVFGDNASQEALLSHLRGICRIGSVLGAPRLVFGSPKNRDRSGLSDDEAFDQGTAFFRRAGDVAAAEGVLLCLEPNPTCYGANFMTTSEETARVVEAVGHAAIRMQLDSGAMTINGEDSDAVVARCAGVIGHVHASEPNLVPLGDGGTDHVQVAHAIATSLPNHPVSIEMVATRDEPHMAAIERALKVADQCYRDGSRAHK